MIERKLRGHGGCAVPEWGCGHPPLWHPPLTSNLRECPKPKLRPRGRDLVSGRDRLPEDPVFLRNCVLHWKRVSPRKFLGGIYQFLFAFLGKSQDPGSDI